MSVLIQIPHTYIFERERGRERARESERENRQRDVKKLLRWELHANCSFNSILSCSVNTLPEQRLRDRNEERRQWESENQATAELIGEGLIKYVYIACWAPFCQSHFQLDGTLSEEFFTPKWLPLINSDLVSPSGQLYPSPCPCPPAFVWLSSSPHGGCEHSGSPCSPSTSPGAVDRTHISFSSWNTQLSSQCCLFYLKAAALESTVDIKLQVTNTSAAVGNMSCTAGR